MEALGSVMRQEKCGFVGIGAPDGFKVTEPSSEFNSMVGWDAEGMSYLDLVCPEDREEVRLLLLSVFEEGRHQAHAYVSFRHRIAMPDHTVLTVALTAGYSPDRLLCSLMRIYQTFEGDTIYRYKSNNVLEAFAVSMAVIYVADEGQFAVKYANGDFYRMIGWNRVEYKEMFNEYLDDNIISPADFPMFRERMLSLDEEHTECMFETHVQHMNGQVSCQEVRARYLFTENEDPVISLVFADVTERKRLRRELLIKNERFNIIQNNANQMVFDYDTEKDRCILSGNLSRAEKYLSLYEIDKHHNEFVVEDFFASRFAYNLVYREDYQMFCDTFANAIISGQGGEVDFRLCLPGQTVGVWYKSVYSTVKDDMGTVVRIVGQLRNIDKQKKTDLMLEKRVNSDILTGLLNKETSMAGIRAFLEDEASSSCDNEKYHAMMIIDMDNFRMINEVFGHTFGDDVIREFASDIKSSFRDTDIVGRIGGDEFIVLMKNVTPKFATKKAGRLCRSLVKSYGVQNVVTVSCSIGVAFYGKDAADFYELYQHADLAMYQAKLSGRCAYCFYHDDMVTDYRRIDEWQNRTSIDTAAGSMEISELDTNLMDIAFSLMSSSDDIYGTLEILLRTMGRKYNLSAVSVLAKTGEPGRLRAVRRWLSNRNVPERSSSPMEQGNIDLDPVFKASPLKCIPDMAASNLPPALRTTLKNDGIGACVFCRLEGRAGESYGYMMFTQFDRKRKWSRKEANTFKYIAKIISVALVEKYTDGSLFADAGD